MFYSHEILASPQYGVATVWLVANLGHNAVNRKLSRKAIENVNVPQACDTIEKPPGAPIALRLQGTLLYGVSGVYLKHGGYLLDDTLKMWARMRTYFRDRGAANLLDPNAGKAKRVNLLLNDDPNFVPDFSLPALDFDDNGDLVLPDLDFTQKSGFSSQHSPVDNSSGSQRSRPFIDLNIHHSSSQATVNLASPFAKPNQPVDDNSIRVFGEDEELPWDNFPIRIDADGNLIEEPELPAHPAQVEDALGELDGPVQKAPSGAHLPDDAAPIILGDDGGQMILADDEQQQQFPVTDNAQHDAQKSKGVPLPSEEVSFDLGGGPQPQRQRRQRKIKSLAPDSTTLISRSELRGWLDNYTNRNFQAQYASQEVTLKEAKRNAYNLVFGMGLGDIGVFGAIPGVEHELAEFFAGDNLKDILMENMLDGVEEGDEAAAEDARGAARRRSASVAFGSEGDQNQDGRRVRSRAGGDSEEQDQQPSHSQQDAQVVDDGMLAFGPDPADVIPEAGRDQPRSALSDHRRSSNAPWNRHSSVEAGRNAVEGSPLVGRGSILQQSNVKHSDDGAAAFGSEGPGPLQYDGAAHDLSSFADFGAAAAVSTQEANTSQFIRQALDREGRNFLGFVEAVAARRGEEDGDGKDLRWVEFDGLFEKQDKTKVMVAQAFLHVLTLATKGQIKVKQQDLEIKPFGEIYVGVTAARKDENLRAEELSGEDAGEDGGEGDEMEGVELEVEQDVE